MRGGVSLAAALAIPLTIEGGTPFPGRGLVLFLTFRHPPSGAGGGGRQRGAEARLRAAEAALLQVRDQGRLSDEVRRRIEQDLDLEDTRLEI